MSSAFWIFIAYSVLEVHNKYVIKEMSILDMRTLSLLTGSLNTPLTKVKKTRSVNSWLQRLYQGLSLEYGDVKYTDYRDTKNI